MTCFSTLGQYVTMNQQLHRCSRDPANWATILQERKSYYWENSVYGHNNIVIFCVLCEDNLSSFLSPSSFLFLLASLKLRHFLSFHFLHLILPSSHAIYCSVIQAIYLVLTYWGTKAAPLQVLKLARKFDLLVRWIHGFCAKISFSQR